jgi:hypothetical protein
MQREPLAPAISGTSGLTRSTRMATRKLNSISINCLEQLARDVYRVLKDRLGLDLNVGDAGKRTT